MFLKTERLYIRPFVFEDIEDVFEIYSNEAVCRYLLEWAWNKNNKKENFNNKLNNKKLDKESVLNLAVLLNEKVIGDILIWYTDMKETVEIGFVFNSNFSKRGYAKEAVRRVIEELFNNYKIHRIQANLDVRNIASANLCNSVGMRREAHFIKDYWNKGEWTDSYVYGMLFSDL
ncbi:GNAT family N-acetyltransferase [Fusobacterium canifelinum]|uniref:N-acetyltransferase n=1 Tax=Fusobacterium canifelinum TaxID=285729 RepID=A0A3P1V268_9FUSO|nr:GNAT family protein [Fusobacterium canifelinum]RRD28294.1 N-acetyltransferase [Fusobacterium canifelinum]